MKNSSADTVKPNPALKPSIELIPLRAGLRSDGPTEIDLLIRITAPAQEVDTVRPPLNLGLVLDRSGSMSGEKLVAAKQAAMFAVEQLQAEDRVAVTIFDDEVETIVPSTIVASNKPEIQNAIRRVKTSGTTALHAGWLEGGLQVSRYQDKKQLNRVLLLTDGQANVGQTDPDRICSDVNGLAKRGVSTTTLGLGSDYNEDLLQAMANSGDGNYYFIESASQLPAIFERELRGLMATFANTVSLGIEPQGKAKVREVLNELVLNENKRLLLANLMAGSPLQVVVRLKVPAQKVDSDVCFVRLAWTDPKTGERHVMRQVLSLPAVSSREFETLPEDERVAEQVAILELARIRAQAIADIERGDIAAARQSTQRGRDFIGQTLYSSRSAPAEEASFDALESHLDADDLASAGKAAKYDNYTRRTSR